MIPLLIENKVCNVRYVKDSGEESLRFIIPSYVPSHLVKAIDVTDLPEAQRQEVADAQTRYRQYVDQIAKGTFSFEDWAELTGYKLPPLKYRSFKVTGLSDIKH